MFKEDRHELDEMRRIDECGMEKFSTIDISSERTFTIPGDRRRSQKAKQEGDKINKTLNVTYGKHFINECPNVEGVSVRSRNGAPSRRGQRSND